MIIIIIITAPYDGIYLFLLDFMGAGNIQVAIAKSGSVLLAITDSDVFCRDQHVFVFVATIMMLVAAPANGREQVWAQHHCGSIVVRRFLWTTFSSSLFHAD